MPHPPDADFIALQEALAGEYSLDRELGRGGMGVVYLAREVRLARPVAIKVLPPALSARPELRKAFLREAQTVAALTHPNIVPVYAVGERGGFVYIAMAFVEGTSLGERIRARGPLLPGQAARVLREVAWALAYAHGAGIVHRDVTAENILLERGSERALVMDFGIASAMQTNALSADGRVMGNAHYVSPEQASGEPVDARSDLYSLGIAGFYALTGRLPFDGESSAEVVTQQLSATAPAITSVSPSVPRLAAAVERCLHKEPFRRYRNAESFAEAIDLAFEHAKEIPAPLRVWLSQGEKELPARVAFYGIGAMTGIGMAVAANFQSAPAGVVALTFLLPFTASVGVSYIPSFFRLRRVLADGYVVDDLAASLREHQLARAEEIKYERRQSSPAFRRAMRILLGASVGGIGIVAAMAWQVHALTSRLRGDVVFQRESIVQLDDQLAMFDRGGEQLQDAERARLADELRETRATAAHRLAATVTALETIRLDLLRLQMGTAGLESVTASLDAARVIGDHISGSIAAQDEIERLLAPSAGASPDAADGPRNGDDADTPVGGVPAAHA